MKRIAVAATLVLTACTPMIWDRPDTTREQFAMDRARCQLTANAITPSQSPRDMGDAVANGITEGLQHAENFNLCMVAIGYQRK